jgi:hypothetical protein
MKRLMTVVSLVALSATAASAATVPAAHSAKHAAKAAAVKPVIPHVVFLKYRVAPADEYFGRLKLSILGIRNTIKDMGLKCDADPAHATQIMNSVALTEDAMHDWEKKYPHDTWIPPAIFSLERLYAKVDSDDARAHAKYVMTWLVKDYPTSGVGKTGRKELADNLVGVKPVAAAAPEPDASTATLAGAGASVTPPTTSDAAATPAK